MALFVFLREKFCSTGFEKYGKENRKEMRERESGGRKTGRKETEGEKEKKTKKTTTRSNLGRESIFVGLSRVFSHHHVIRACVSRSEHIQPEERSLGYFWDGPKDSM